MLRVKFAKNSICSLQKIMIILKKEVFNKKEIFNIISESSKGID